MAGVRLEDLTWIAAAGHLTKDALVVLPIGAALKEHGPHLLLSNDRTLADYLAARVVAVSSVLLAPTLTHHYYPAFLEYPGSVSLRLETARDLVADVCRSLARHGPRRFYALNTGVSTLRALAPAAATLLDDGILLRHTDILRAIAPVEHAVAQQPCGTHADEIETSMMLYIAPDKVDMRRAVRECPADHPEGGLTRDPNGRGTYSPSGVFGDATLATREKGRLVTEALVQAILAEIESLRKEPPPGA